MVSTANVIKSELSTKANTFDYNLSDSREYWDPEGAKLTRHGDMY